MNLVEILVPAKRYPLLDKGQTEKGRPRFLPLKVAETTTEPVEAIFDRKDPSRYKSGQFLTELFNAGAVWLSLFV